MDFLLEPMELGAEYDKLLDSSVQTTSCDTGYVCASGTIEPDNKAP